MLGPTEYKALPLTMPLTMFLSTGDKIREGNYFSSWRELNMDMANVKEYCRELIFDTIRDFQKSRSDTLILDCVKDLEDAKFVATQAKDHGFSITRAILYDIDNEDHLDQLEQQWQKRAKNTSALLRVMHDSVYEYLYQWKRDEHNDLLNYYKKKKLLSKVTSLSDWRFLCQGLGFEYLIRNYPICSPLNNLQFMLLKCDLLKNVFMSLHSVLNVSQFQFTLPISFVHSYRDVKWVASPSRYYVTAKADGVRCLLLKVSDGTYLITRKNEIYPCCVADDQIPENTVLDGELLPSTSMSEIDPKMITSELKTSVFLAFDALAVSGDVLWKWPFRLRLESLGKLSIRKDILAVMKQALANDQSSTNLGSSPNKQLLTIHCPMKGHRQSTPEDILRCLDTEFPYSCDGLIFTPDKTYVFGPDPLMFKWQCEDDAQGYIRLNYVENGQQPFSKEYFLCSLVHVRNFDKDESESIVQYDRGHPVKNFSFDALFSDLSELVQLGKVEKSVDLDTGLEVFSCCSSSEVRDPMMVRLSRGLVVHPPSKTVVTRPFVRFYEGEL